MDKIMQRYDEIKLNHGNLVEMERLAFCVNNRFLDTREQLILEYGKLSSYLAFDSGYTFARYKRLASILANISEKIDDFENLSEFDILVLKKVIVYLNLDLGLSISFYSVFENMVLSEEFHFIKNNLKIEYDFDDLYNVMLHKEKERKRRINNPVNIPAILVDENEQILSKEKLNKQNRIMKLYLEQQNKDILNRMHPRVSLEKQIRSYNTRLAYLKRSLERTDFKLDSSEKKIYLNLLSSFINKGSYAVMSQNNNIFARKMKTFLESKIGVGISDIEMYKMMLENGELDIDVSMFENEHELFVYLEEVFGNKKKPKRR